MFVTPVNMLGGDVVAAPAYPSQYAFDMELGTGKAHVPDVDFDTLRRGLREQARDRIGAEGNFEGVT